jgi:hypothetical protein
MQTLIEEIGKLESSVILKQLSMQLEIGLYYGESRRYDPTFFIAHLIATIVFGMVKCLVSYPDQVFNTNSPDRCQESL